MKTIITAALITIGLTMPPTANANNDQFRADLTNAGIPTTAFNTLEMWANAACDMAPSNGTNRQPGNRIPAHRRRQQSHNVDAQSSHRSMGQRQTKHLLTQGEYPQVPARAAAPVIDSRVCDPEVGRARLMPFSSTTIRTRRRDEVRRRDGRDALCALQIMPDCQVLGGLIDYAAKPPHPRSFEVDHVVSSDEAQRMGWSDVEADALENCQAVCRQCNRQKSAGVGQLVSIRATYVNPRFAVS